MYQRAKLNAELGTILKICKLFPPYSGKIVSEIEADALAKTYLSKRQYIYYGIKDVYGHLFW